MRILLTSLTLLVCFPLSACGEVTVTKPRPGTAIEVQQQQLSAPRYPVCLSVDGLRRVAARLTRNQMEGISFVPQRDLPSGCKAATIPAGYPIGIIGHLPDRDNDWLVPVGELVIPEPVGSPFRPTVYGYALFPAQAVLGGRSQYRRLDQFRTKCPPFRSGMTAAQVRAWHKRCG